MHLRVHRHEYKTKRCEGSGLRLQNNIKLKMAWSLGDLINFVMYRLGNVAWGLGYRCLTMPIITAECSRVIVLTNGPHCHQCLHILVGFGRVWIYVVQ